MPVSLARKPANVVAACRDRAYLAPPRRTHDAPPLVHVSRDASRLVSRGMPRSRVCCAVCARRLQLSNRAFRRRVHLQSTRAPAPRRRARPDRMTMSRPFLSSTSIPTHGPTRRNTPREARPAPLPDRVSIRPHPLPISIPIPSGRAPRLISGALSVLHWVLCYSRSDVGAASTLCVRPCVPGARWGRVMSNNTV